jgi:cytochrome c556
MLAGLRLAWAALVIAAVCGIGSWPTAHEGATGIVGERMKAMTRLADEMKALARLIKTRDASAREIARRATLIRDLGRNIPAMFPPGTDKDPHTGAKTTIWQSRSEFEELAARSERQAEELVQAAEQGDRTKTRESFTALTQSCGACHERFRVKRHSH